MEFSETKIFILFLTMFFFCLTIILYALLKDYYDQKKIFYNINSGLRKCKLCGGLQYYDQNGWRKIRSIKKVEYCVCNEYLK